MKNSNYDRITKISLSDDTNNVILIDDLNEKDIVFNEMDPEDSTYLNRLFNIMANDDIRLIKHLSGDRLLVVTKTKDKKNIATEISDYSNIKNKKYFKKMHKTILEYNLAKVLYNLYKESKTKRFKIAFAGSLIATTTIISINYFSEATNAEMNTTNEAINKYIVQADQNNLQNNVDEIIIENNNIEEKAVAPFDINSIKEYNVHVDSVEPNKNNNTIKSENDITNTQINNTNTTNFADIKNFKNYDEYIKFAANLFYVDYNEAKNIVGQNFNTFTNSTHIELSRMKALKDKGIIEGDLNIMGIFITIKDYAISHYGIDSQTPIKTNKTPEEREIDLINVAQNIYGINDVELLNCIIAVHRLETGHGKEAIATEKNNLGGNLSAKYKDQIVVNTYKTTEIGAESMIRNFLNVYYKCLYDERCNNVDPTPVFMSKLYCTHTPEAWATEVTNLLNEGKIQPAVNKYLGNTKTY